MSKKNIMMKFDDINQTTPNHSSTKRGDQKGHEYVRKEERSSPHPWQSFRQVQEGLRYDCKEHSENPQTRYAT